MKRDCITIYSDISLNWTLYKIKTVKTHVSQMISVNKTKNLKKNYHTSKNNLIYLPSVLYTISFESTTLKTRQRNSIIITRWNTRNKSIDDIGNL